MLATYQLYPHQQEAVERLLDVFRKYPQRGFLLADAPRVGKTYVALEFIRLTGLRGLILAPASVVGMWRNLINIYNINAVAVSYEYFRTHSQEFSDCALLILDEAHKCKNSRAQITKKVREYARTRFVLAMTGTPFQNAPGELKSIIDVTKQYSNIVYTAAQWIETRWGKEFVWISERLHELRTQLQQQRWYLRRELAEVAKSLPPIRRTVVEANRNDWQRITNEINDYLNKLLQEEQEAERREKLQRIINGVFELDDLGVLFAQASTLRHNLGVAKALHAAEYAIELLDSTGEQVLIFTHHSEVRNIIAKQLSDNNISYDIISGDTPQHNRSSIANRFQSGELQCLILSTRAAGEGLTLSAARHAVFAELDWNPAVLYQAENRMRVINDSESRIAHYIIAPHPLERRMMQLINYKATAALKVYTSEITTIKKHKVMEAKFRIGFSELPVIMGAVSYSNPLQLWRRKLGLEPPQEETLPILIGKSLEDPLFRLFCEIEELDYSQFSVQQRVEINDWLAGHCDYVDLVNNEPYEVKIVSSLKNVDGYIIQLNAQMHALGAMRGYLIVLHNNHSIHKIEHDYDASLWQRSFEAAQRFYECLVQHIPPTQIVDTSQLPKETKNISVYTYSELSEILKEYTQIDEQLKALEEQKKTLKGRIDELMKSSGVDKIKTAYATVSFVKTTRKQLDEQALRAVINLDDYYRTVEIEYLRVLPTTVKTAKKTSTNNQNEGVDS